MDNLKSSEVDRSSSDPRVAGKWEALSDTEIFVVHAALLHTGKVLIFSGSAERSYDPQKYPLESRIWDPITNTFTKQLFEDNLFCSGHAFLDDGSLLVNGGAIGDSDHGLKTTNIFDPIKETWTKGPDMKRGRWYPTTLTLGDGRIITFSGRDEDQAVNNLVEIYYPKEKIWKVLRHATREFKELYPSIHLLPNGSLFYSRVGWGESSDCCTQTAYLPSYVRHYGGWVDAGLQKFPDRQEGTAVLLVYCSEPQRLDKRIVFNRPIPSLGYQADVYVIGGGHQGNTSMNPRSCERIRFAHYTAIPKWEKLEDMHQLRTNIDAVVLPDGTIFVVGGTVGGHRSEFRADSSHSHGSHFIRETEIYDPLTGQWKEVAKLIHPHQYHAIALLLPDGRVLRAGGIDTEHKEEISVGKGVANWFVNQRYMEVFSPPYLFRGERPIIRECPKQISYNNKFSIVSPNVDEISSIALLHPGAITHHTDPNQRYIRLPFETETEKEEEKNQLTVSTPVDGDTAPPGYYMLFMVNFDGVPSVGRFVQIGLEDEKSIR